MKKLSVLICDNDFLALTRTLINGHNPGVSTGSCLSPALSNLYLADFDRDIEDKSLFYSRYVDDMLVSPAENIALVSDKLAENIIELVQSLGGKV